MLLGTTGDSPTGEARMSRSTGDDYCPMHPRVVLAPVVVRAVHRESYGVSCVRIHTPGIEA
jgi:hypothetical protein